MSTNLFWRPPPVDPEGECLSKGLKYAIARKLWDHDGSLGGDWITIDESFIPFLEGIAAAASERETRRDAETLIEQIRKLGAVQVGLYG